MSEPDEIPPAEDVETPPVREPLGDALRRAREARGLTVADVSHALKFSPRQIEAIEADLFDILPGRVFVRGFVRSYAKFLKLDETPLLGMLEADSEPAVTEVRAPENMGVAVDASARHPTSLLVPAAILLGLSAAAIGAWHFLSGGATSSPPGPPKAASDSVAAPAAAVVVQAPQVRIESSSDQAGAQNAGTPQPVALPPGMRQIVLEFSEKSWLEIKDATQKVVLTGEHPAGTRQIAVGKPPFQLWVGRASAVRVHYDDREIDLRPHAREDVARLTVQ